MSAKELQSLPIFIPKQHSKRSQIKFFSSPAWIFLLGALAVRIWMVVHTQGIIEGDEALLGIQAEQIVHGAHPIYFFGQPYMGTLEAHLVALIFLVTGPSTWALRAEPILLSILLMWLTWKLANALADLARLPDYARLWFVMLAMAMAAAPPLYDLVVELRTYGGYIETFVLMLWLVLAALRLTQRWREASTREIVLRWMGIGFLIGLGLWVYPLIIVAILAATLWIAGYLVREIVQIYQHQETQQTLIGLGKKLLLVFTAIPTALIGFAPGLYWGAQNNWANITYLVSNSTGSSGSRLRTIAQVTKWYGICSVPRVVGGALPPGNGGPAAHHLVTPELIFGGCCLLITVVAFGVSLIWRQRLLIQMRRLVALPLLFAGCSAVIFCTSSISTSILSFRCGNTDIVGRYTTPLLLVLPFLLAAALTLIAMAVVERKRDIATQNHWPNALRLGLLMVVLFSFCVEGYSYWRSSPNYTMQTSGCVVAPANDAPIIAYMQQQHIRYAWGSIWVGHPIIFATGGSIVVIDPRIITDPLSTNRFPAYTSAVFHADRPSILLLAAQNDMHPDLLTKFDQEGITYRVARFPSEPGVDLLVITPLNRSVSPSDGNDLGVYFGGC